MAQGKEGMFPSGGVNKSDRISIQAAQDGSLDQSCRIRPAASLEGTVAQWLWPFIGSCSLSIRRRIHADFLAMTGAQKVWCCY